MISEDEIWHCFCPMRRKMITYILQRLSSNDICTLGVIKDEKNNPFMDTLELPWLNNQHNISCIPTGIYNCARTIHPKHGEVFQVMDVPDRNDILIHVGNFPKDTNGCILVGLSFTSEASIGESRIAFKKFMDRLDGVEKFTLKIQEA
jgi:hypothetical protein